MWRGTAAHMSVEFELPDKTLDVEAEEGERREKREERREKREVWLKRNGGEGG